jgi:hypothetical protein
MSRSFLIHLSLNFYRSRQADYRHVLYGLLAWYFMARILSVSRSQFSYGKHYTDFFSQKKFLKGFFSLEICYWYD